MIAIAAPAHQRPMWNISSNGRRRIVKTEPRGLSSEDGYPSAMTPSIVQDGGTPSSRTTSCMGVVDRPRHLGRRIVDRLREGHAGRGGAYRTSACNSSFSNSPEKHSKREAARGDSEKRSVISWRFCSFGRVFAVKH